MATSGRNVELHKINLSRWIFFNWHMIMCRLRIQKIKIGSLWDFEKRPKTCPGWPKNGQFLVWPFLSKGQFNLLASYFIPKNRLQTSFCSRSYKSLKFGPNWAKRPDTSDIRPAKRWGRWLRLAQLSFQAGLPCKF